MTDKAQNIVIVAVGVIVCAVLVFAIVRWVIPARNKQEAIQWKTWVDNHRLYCVKVVGANVDAAGTGTVTLKHNDRTFVLLIDRQWAATLRPGQRLTLDTIRNRAWRPGEQGYE